VTVGAVGANGAPQLQTSWTRAEAACAARHRGDAYYALTHPTPKPDGSDPTIGGLTSKAASASPAPNSPTSTSDTSTAAASDVATSDLAPGFSLHL